jgi:hypothetical protein
MLRLLLFVTAAALPLVSCTSVTDVAVEGPPAQAPQASEVQAPAQPDPEPRVEAPPAEPSAESKEPEQPEQLRQEPDEEPREDPREEPEQVREGMVFASDLSYVDRLRHRRRLRALDRESRGYGRDDFVYERTPPSRVVRAVDREGNAAMPFGRGMGGPWRTGGVTSDP